MTSYLDRLLLTDETVRHHTRSHPLPVFFRPLLLHVLGFVLAVILSLVATRRADAVADLPRWLLILPPLLPLPVTAWTYLVWRTRQFVVTNQRVIHLEGVLAKRHHDAAIAKINDIELSQSLMGRLFGWGDLTVYTGNDVHGVAYRRLARPVEFKRALGNDRQAAPAADGSDRLDRLERLGRLRQQGVLTEDEFQAEKRRLLEEP